VEKSSKSAMLFSFKKCLKNKGGKNEQKKEKRRNSLPPNPSREPVICGTIWGGKKKKKMTSILSSPATERAYTKRREDRVVFSLDADRVSSRAATKGGGNTTSNPNKKEEKKNEEREGRTYPFKSYLARAEHSQKIEKEDGR